MSHETYTDVIGSIESQGWQSATSKENHLAMLNNVVFIYPFTYKSKATNELQNFNLDSFIEIDLKAEEFT